MLDGKRVEGEVGSLPPPVTRYGCPFTCTGIQLYCVDGASYWYVDLAFVLRCPSGHPSPLHQTCPSSSSPAPHFVASSIHPHYFGVLTYPDYSGPPMITPAPFPSPVPPFPWPLCPRFKVSSALCHGSRMSLFRCSTGICSTTLLVATDIPPRFTPLALPLTPSSPPLPPLQLLISMLINFSTLAMSRLWTGTRRRFLPQIQSSTYLSPSTFSP